MQRALIMHAPGSPSDSGQRIYVEHFLEPDEYEAVTPDSRPKAERILGVSGEQPLTWLKRESSDRGRMVRSKALAKLGATLDDVRIEKALLVLGEAPGREVPAGRLPRPSLEPPRKVWAMPPPKSKDAPAPSVSVFLIAFFPWGVLAPLNVLKLQLNKVSPGAHLWVPAATEQCQAACGVARMWATLFWSLQFASAIAAIYLHYNRERGLALLGVSQKVRRDGQCRLHLGPPSQPSTPPLHANPRPLHAAPPPLTCTAGRREHPPQGLRPGCHLLADWLGGRACRVDVCSPLRARASQTLRARCMLHGGPLPTAAMPPASTSRHSLRRARATAQRVEQSRSGAEHQLTGDVDAAARSTDAVAEGGRSLASRCWQKLCMHAQSGGWGGRI